MFEGSKQAINFHITQACDMACGYCFSVYETGEKKCLSLYESKSLISRLAEYGAKKLTFVGGEPTLCPWLGELITHTKSLGLTTMIVTNGTGLTDEFLLSTQDTLDWIGVSVNSLHLSSLKAIGSQSPRQTVDGDFYYRLVEKIKHYGYKLKINTVVCSVNQNESFVDFINFAEPKRWKIFQILPITPNSQRFIVTLGSFRSFHSRHTPYISPGTSVIAETNNLMTESYVMVDPIGRFYDNGKGRHNYSKPILDVGVEEAFRQINVNEDKMLERVAIYDW